MRNQHSISSAPEHQVVLAMYSGWSPEVGRVSKTCTQIKVLLLYDKSDSSKIEINHQNNYLTKSTN